MPYLRAVGGLANLGDEDGDVLDDAALGLTPRTHNIGAMNTGANDGSGPLQERRSVARGPLGHVGA